MSLKDLFGKTSEKIVSNKQLQDLYSQAESEGFLEELIVDKERFLPSINFYTASNFARYGSAEKYYVDAIKNIYQNYPYDGSKKEQLKWRNNSSQLDLFVFDNIHPSTTGYVNLNIGTPTVVSGLRYVANPSYITVKGGPNKAIDDSFNNSNIYNLNTNRESNLGITNYGNTVEFWFKDNLNPSSAAYESGFAFFDLWNGVASGSTNYTRLTIAHTGSSTLLITYASGNVGIVNEQINYNLDKSSWHHYAFVFDNSSTDLKLKLFLDGNLHSINSYNNCGFNSLADNSNIIANIGCYIANSAGLSSGNTTGASYGSYDEFRFWKSARTSQEIYRNWYTQVGGGSNTDDANTDLGVYFKFNEGIIDSSNVNDVDKICLDYSGRISNGLIINYDINVRSTGSAIDNYFNETIEEKTPILYSSNPLVISKIDEYAALGAVYDRENNSSIYNSLPSWITDEAEVKELPDLQNLTQIISSYFDTIHNQIGALTSIKNVDYDGKAKPKPFIKNALLSNGFDTAELFNNSTFLEEILSKTEEYNFDDKISNIKNFIYQNIYNNLSYIYKSKGTEKSFRNLVRCFGVDDELIKINLYANNAQYDLTDSYDYTTVYKKFVDFNDASRYEAVVFQKAKTADSNTKGYISGSLNGLLNNIPITLQTEVIFPRKFAYDETALTTNNFINVSLFGVRTAKEDEADLSFSDADDFNLKVYAIKNNFDSVDAYFKLVGNLSGSAFTLTSSLYKDVYDNQKWNFSVRIKPNNYGQAQQSYLNENSDYTLEFTGYNTLLDSDVNESFKLSTLINKNNAEAGLSKNKRIYLGANCTNFTAGTAVEKSDVKISSVRYWLDYLEDEELKVHSYDSSNYGRKYPNWNVSYTDKPLTKINSLLLNWEFNKVTGSDSNGNFIVDDLTSGSLVESEKETYGFYGKLLNIQYPAFGNYFSANDSQVVNKEYIYSAKQKLPETFNGSDLIQVPVVDDVRQSKINKPVSFYFSIEKSISQVINSEILNWFATIKDFNNLIGEPIEKYNSEYKNLKHLRQLFFEKVNNTPDVERFIEFYKWLDSSISLMISQLIPASANVSEKVRNVIESHLLERNKYENKLPRIERREEIVSNVSSHLDYSYIEQAAHTNNLTSSIVVNDKVIYEPLWLKNRVSRNNPLVSTSVEPQNDIDREIIRQVANNKYFNKSVTLYSADEDIVYEGNEEKNRQFAKIYRFLLDKMIVVDTFIQATSVENYSFDSIQLNNINEESKITNQKKNFVNTYEYFNTVSRTGNNKSFVDAQGNVSGTFTNSGLGFYSRTLPNRLMEDGERRKTIIAERFSAPGGPEVLSRGTLDRDGEEYSVYNELNNRNYRVRKNNNTWLAETSSIDSENPSLHKVNKNAATLASNISGSTSRKQYDNEYVSHAIPRSDGQYAWVKRFVPSTGTLSGYLDDPFNSLNISYISSARKFINYEVPESPEFSYNITNSVSSSTNYSGALYDSGGNTGSYSVNERYYFTVIPTSSDGRTWDTGTSIGYTLSSSVSTSLSGNVFSKLRIYTADDPEQLVGKNFRFPDVWRQVNVVSGTTNISSSALYLSGVLPSNITSPWPDGFNEVNIHSMDTSGSTIFMVGNFGYVSSSVSGVLAVPGFLAYDYALGTYSNPLTGSVGGLYPNPTTSSYWLPANIAYTKYNNSEYLIFAGYWHNFNADNYRYSNSLTVYNLTLKKWNTYTRANGTEVSSMIKNLGGTTAYNNQFNYDLSLIVNSTASSQYVYTTGLYQRNLDGSTIYPDIYGRNENKNLHYFSIDPDSPIFCSGTLYQTLMGNSMYGGAVIDNLGPTLPIAYVFDKDNNLYLGSNWISGNAGDTEYYNIIKYDLKNNIKTPIRSNEEVFLRIPNGGGAGNTIITSAQVGKLDISGSILVAYSLGYGVSFNVAAIYDLENDTITNVTGGISQFDYRQGQGSSRGFRGSFLINNYLYTTAVISWADSLRINRSYYKHDNRFEDANKLFRYHVFNDNDNYFSPVIGNGEPSYTNYQGYGNYIDVGEGIKLGKNLPYDGITSSLYFAATLNGGTDFVGRKLVQFNIFDASKYYERTYPVKSYGSNITNSIDITGSNFLVTWTSNDVTASGFQLSWNKQAPTIVKREEKTNFLGLRTNALSDYYFTDLQLSADLDKNLISFANKNTYTSSNALNDYLLNTNGPYKHASWRQIRNDKNPIVKSTRKNNRIIRQNNPNRGEGRSDNFTSYKEPPVDYNLPMTHDVLVANSNDIPVKIIDTYDNNLNKFSNEQLMADAAQKTRIEPQTHDILLNYSKDEIYRTQVLPITASYVQIVFPQKNNFGVSDVRKRNNYNDSDSTDSVLATNTFWRDNYQNRRRIIDSFSAYGYYTSSFASLPNYSASVLNEIDRFIELKNTSSNLDTGSMTVFFDSYTGNNKFYESVFVLDNKSYNYNADSIVERSQSAENVNLSARVNFGEQQVGFLAPYKQPEHIYFITRPAILDSNKSGSSITDIYGSNMAGIKYANKRIFPRAQLIFTNHQPSYTFYPNRSGSKGGVEVDGDRDTLTENIKYFERSVGITRLFGGEAIISFPETNIYGNYNVASKFYTINNGYTYETDVISGKKPFYDSYEEFYEDIRGNSKNYSIITEYKINDYIDDLVINNIDLTNINTYKDHKLNFSIKGHDFDISKLNTVDKIEYINSNPINANFTNYDSTLIPQEININVNAIIKFLPYRGFYPADRVSQLSQLFIDSLFKKQLNGILDVDSNVTYDGILNAGELNSLTNPKNSGGTPIDQQMLTMLQPFFAPGILLNTIKSSVATDWLTMFSNPYYSSNTVVTSYTTGSYLEEAYSGSDGARFYVAGTSSVIPYKLPFESIIDFEKYIPRDFYTCSLHYLDPTHYSSDAIGNLSNSAVYPSIRLDDNVLNTKNEPNIYNISWKDDRYKLAINNFLATIPDIFLKNKRPASIVSEPLLNFKEAVSGTTYYMDVVLERPITYKPYVYDRWHDYLDKQKNSKFSYTSSPSVSNLKENEYGSMTEDSIFGPPIKFWYKNKFNDINNGVTVNYPWQYAPYRMVSAPAYAPYVPPYYYGKSIARISFTAPAENKKYNLEEIFSNISIEYINEEMDNLFISRNLLFSAFSLVNDTGDPWKETPAYKFRSNLSSSINLLGKKEISLTDLKADGTINNVPITAGTNYAWSIQLKYETPSINFNKVKSPLTQFIGGKRRKDSFFGFDDGYIDGIYSQEFKGLWTSYGEPVKNEDAITFNVVESPNKLSEKQGSLLDLCGFKQAESEKIGILADNAEFTEAVVVIPYVNKYNNYDSTTADTLAIKQFTNLEVINDIEQDNLQVNLSDADNINSEFLFKVDTTILKKLIPDIDFSNYSKNRTQEIIKILNANRDADGFNNSILKTIDLMTKYVLPPPLDWINNNLQPFVMYIFEFKKSVDKNDLSDLWQNVMPNELREAEKVSININHRLSELEFFHGKKLPPNIKFKIFKVKKRAKYNYYDLTDTIKDNDKFNYQNAERFKYNSYNWPYDFYSLVELVNVEATVKSEYKQVVNDNKDNSLITPVASPLLSKEIAEAVKKLDLKKNKF